MFNRLKLVKNEDNTYDLYIFYDSKNEFSKEFYEDDVKNFKIKKVIKNIKIFLLGTLVISIPFMSLSEEEKAKYIYEESHSLETDVITENINSKINLGYLFFGSYNEQINYVTRTNKIDIASPSYFNLNSSGNLELNNINIELINKLHNEQIKITPFLSNHWDKEKGIRALNNIDKLTNDISEAINLYNLDGINIDIENLSHLERDKYSLFVKTLREKLPSDKQISVAVAANPYNYKTGWHASYDYIELAKYADYLIIMSYDEHYSGSDEGAICSIDFFEKSLKYAINKIDKYKIVMGYALYGRIWSKENIQMQGLGVSNEVINLIKKNYNYKVIFDEVTLTPKIEFNVGENDKKITISNHTLTTGEYVVWYEDNTSLGYKNHLIETYDVKGSAFWALGQENIDIWKK